MEASSTGAVSTEICDSIKLSEFHQIQTYACLLVIDENLRVLQYSANVTSLLHTPLQQILNHPVSTFLQPENGHEEYELRLKEENYQYQRFYWQAPDKKILVWVSSSQDSGQILVEIEPARECLDEKNNLFDIAQKVIANMQISTKYNSINEVAQSTCEEIRKITAYDQVIVYQFSQVDYSGIAVAEALGNNMESYLGLHFPATDIPAGVRKMYVTVPIRFIPDIYEKPINVLSANTSTPNTNLDLSFTNLRMVAEVHLKYLTNMGVVSSASIAILRDKQLWGIIVCHHRTAKYLSIDNRLVLKLIANTLATQIAVIESTKFSHDQQRMVELQNLLTTDVSKQKSFIEALNYYHRQFMELVSATGMSIYFQGNLLNYGATPNTDEIIRLISWLQVNQTSISYATSTLPIEYPDSMPYKDKACGLLAIRIIPLENHFLLFYKPELIHTIAWAGNPKEAVKREQHSYSPRDSFARFIETIINHSAPWSMQEIQAAEYIQSIVVNKQLQDLLQLQAMHDPLTGLLNRLYLNQTLTIEIRRAARENKYLSIILMDLDFFKIFNDNFGHLAGDLVLSEFAKFLIDHFRGYDYIYRYGGEEFLILLPGLKAQQAFEKAEKLRIDIQELELDFHGTVLPPITISGGISTYPTNGGDTLALIAAADTALYEAKSKGRNQIIKAIVK